MHVYIEAVQGDMGWSSSEVREATAKVAFERRVSTLPDSRWAREVYEYVHLRCLDAPTQQLRSTTMCRRGA